MRKAATLLALAFAVAAVGQAGARISASSLKRKEAKAWRAHAAASGTVRFFKTHRALLYPPTPLRTRRVAWRALRHAHVVLSKTAHAIMRVRAKIEASSMPATFARWDRLVRGCEAPGSGWWANTGNGFYFGPQFTPGTWHSSGGGPVAEMGDAGGRPMRSYSIAEIVRVADEAMRQQGPWAWPWCHAHGYI